MLQAAKNTWLYGNFATLHLTCYALVVGGGLQLNPSQLATYPYKCAHLTYDRRRRSHGPDKRTFIR